MRRLAVLALLLMAGCAITPEALDRGLDVVQQVAPFLPFPFNYIVLAAGGAAAAGLAIKAKKDLDEAG